MTVQESSHTELIDVSHLEEYGPDALSRTKTLVSIVAAAAGGSVFVLTSWFVLKTTNLPAFGPSMVTRAIATATTLAMLIVLAILTIAWAVDEKRQRPHPKWRAALTYLVSYLSPAGLVVTTIGIPLSATRLYLDGITVDQGFRTQFMTRLTDSWTLSDMNYIDMPSFYPGMWFWFGGRVGNLLHLPGWEAFQPWALISLGAAGSVLVPVWQRLVRSLPVATGIALVSTAVTLVMSAEEPYAGIIALGAPAALILARRALLGGRFAMVGVIIYLGASASSYTLYTAAVALSTVVIAAVFAGMSERSFTPILRLIVIGVGSMAIAAVWWAPYFLAIARGNPVSGATASHYLPIEGTQVPLPMFAPSLVGILCFIGLVYLIIRFTNDDVRILGIGLIVFYCWVASSMVLTLTGTTLLGFRLDIVIVMQLVTAGVLGLAELRIYSIHVLFPKNFSVRTSRSITIAFIAIVTAGGLNYAQSIPNHNASSIDRAYNDTDGYGERADRYPPDATQYYADIASSISEQVGKKPRDTVVLTDELNFMSYHPFRGFQAFTSHYANPLGEFDRRNEAITQWALDSWAQAATPAEFAATIDDAAWQAPDAFIFRADLDATTQALANNDDITGWVYDLAEDIYPNNPNVRFRGVRFNPAVFIGADSPWSVSQIGPFVVVTR